MRFLMPLAAGLLALLSLAAAPAAAELDQETFEKAASDALRNMKQPGLEKAKLGTIATLTKDDRRRSVELLVRWAAASGKLERRKLVPARDKAAAEFEKLEKILRKAYARMPPNRVNDKEAWDKKKSARDRAQRDLDQENRVQYELGVAVAATRNRDAIAWLLKAGLKQLRREDEAGEAAVGAVKALLEADRALVAEALLEEAKSRKHPKARILALEWIGKTKNAAGYPAALGALVAKADPVRRAAVACLVALDDPRCVEMLIDTMPSTVGILRSEIEDALHNFTGQSFDESPEVWARWWAEKGAAWLEEESRKRWGRVKQRRGGTSFYGLETKSKRIVFVLDRSGSMSTPATGEERAAGEEGKEVEGGNKLEVAKRQLERSVKMLPPDVYFNVVFFSNDVQQWLDPPEMKPATDANKKAAIEWFMKLEPNGRTATFDALLRALEYADNLDEKDPTKGGCDTIFLLSDGSPTKGTGQEVVQGEELEQEWGRVKEANRIFRCVIHTIGVGAQHNRSLLQRIARETGGTYKDVGSG